MIGSRVRLTNFTDYTLRNKIYGWFPLNRLVETCLQAFESNWSFIGMQKKSHIWRI